MLIYGESGKGDKVMAKELTCTFYINGEKVDSLSEEQLERMSERLSKAMSRYYSDRPEEYIKLQKGVTTCS
jgi:hypothetical protein